jgi:hypothetical protein
MKIINVIQDNKYLPDPLYPDPEILTKGAEILMKNFAGCMVCLQRFHSPFEGG